MLEFILFSQLIGLSAWVPISVSAYESGLVLMVLKVLLNLNRVRIKFGTLFFLSITIIILLNIPSLYNIYDDSLSLFFYRQNIIFFLVFFLFVASYPYSDNFSIIFAKILTYTGVINALIFIAIVMVFLDIGDLSSFVLIKSQYALFIDNVVIPNYEQSLILDVFYRWHSVNHGSFGLASMLAVSALSALFLSFGKRLYIFYIILILTAVLLTGSRSSLAVFFIMSFVLFIFRQYKTIHSFYIVIFILLSLTLLSLLFLLQIDTFDSSPRMQIYNEAFRALSLEFWPAGFGQSDSLVQNIGRGHVHSSMIAYLSEAGILFTLMIFFTISFFLALVYSNIKSERLGFIGLYLVLLIAILFLALFETSILARPSLMQSLFIMVLILASTPRRVAER
jgi:O-antigen ligase